MTRRYCWHLFTAPILAVGLLAKQGQCAAPLPSWNDGEVKAAIVQFVTAVVTKGGPKYVPAEERIATFDNDGTLWSEQPVVQGMFLMHKLKRMAKELLLVLEMFVQEGYFEGHHLFQALRIHVVVLRVFQQVVFAGHVVLDD